MEELDESMMFQSVSDAQNLSFYDYDHRMEMNLDDMPMMKLDLGDIHLPPPMEYGSGLSTYSDESSTDFPNHVSSLSFDMSSTPSNHEDDDEEEDDEEDDDDNFEEDEADAEEVFEGMASKRKKCSHQNKRTMKKSKVTESKAVTISETKRKSTRTRKATKVIISEESEVSTGEEGESSSSNRQNNSPFQARRTKSGRRRLADRVIEGAQPLEPSLSKQQRNKISAKNYRLRTKQYVQSLEDRVSELNDDKNKLSSEVQHLNDHVNFLTQFIQASGLSVPKFGSQLFFVVFTLFLFSAPLMNQLHQDEVRGKLHALTHNLPSTHDHAQHEEHKIRYGGGRRLLEFVSEDDSPLSPTCLLRNYIEFRSGGKCWTEDVDAYDANPLKPNISSSFDLELESVWTSLRLVNSQ